MARTVEGLTLQDEKSAIVDGTDARATGMAVVTCRTRVMEDQTCMRRHTMASPLYIRLAITIHDQVGELAPAVTEERGGMVATDDLRQHPWRPRRAFAHGAAMPPRGSGPVNERLVGRMFRVLL